ncbi:MULTISPECIES: glycosyltransferase family 2 protein [unclassified Chamaesiphon]|uniref:glycosyltransferase family 2 protein n=1 Tax=unclassified Chamaesiphon TaxID=2620921 RepID=UPI00286AFC78|nr:MULTISPECIES: glycosyltransferase family 2 protein [unclassified Chamaesiphon]
MQNPTIAVLMTCYNRKQKTLDSLDSLFSQDGGEDRSLSVYLVDDGSTDGTTTAVAAAYPQVNILQGDGSLFWNRGMHMAFAAALVGVASQNENRDYDYYLWLNDDTILYPAALAGLLHASDAVAAKGNPQAIIVGATCDPQTGVLTYGGLESQDRYRPLRFSLVAPGSEPQRCDTLNGNCVLIPKSVAGIVGNLDPAFTHYLGDLDYGLRTQKQGGSVWLAPGFCGTCSQNLRPRTWTETTENLPWYLQWQRVGQPKGLNLTQMTLPPVTEWKIFAQRYAGLLWPVYWLFPYLRLLLLPVVRIGSNLRSSQLKLD